MRRRFGEKILGISVGYTCRGIEVNVLSRRAPATSTQVRARHGGGAAPAGSAGTGGYGCPLVRRVLEETNAGGRHRGATHA